ncbi:hypothetical protein HWQ46_17315 [Shewanella sp. D64]|uniref:hypothetical protein n=1 Tax=unclassified Shewanella TaxID=196818 RepID=UPI0022BA207C|nr:MULTISPECIES: hypothetical protein [unclassified Shewanella]MEC4727309.1 hypothetical protein [Shewanella sp. D64]MEC4739464.1 hypothetical protein [Shewanella sp. E94]WBJ96793.1 hypothetical protein HWQ47_06650 [Shewanella sp. MTB7]
MQVEIYNQKTLESDKYHFSQALLLLITKGLPITSVPAVREALLRGDEYKLKDLYIVMPATGEKPQELSK